MGLRELVVSRMSDPWYAAHDDDINFELNHLELHDLDGYVYKLYEDGCRVSNPNNSNVAFLIGITDDEPLSRIKCKGGSFPDIDIDFEHESRDLVVQHLKEEYGEEYVSGIGTFMFSKARGIFKDTSRIFGLDFHRSNELSKMIPDRPDLQSLSEALAESPELKKEYDSDELVKTIIDYAQNLEGTIRSVGSHACGFVIGVEPLNEMIPLFTSKDSVVTQFDGPTLEKIGLIKFDILGLKNLTVMRKTLNMVEKHKGIKVSLDYLDYNDPKVYDIISSGNSLGVFQIEGSKGLRDFAAASKPECLEDLSAIISLYRPGPLGMDADTEYIKRKGRPSEENKFVFEDYDYIFKDTCGLMIYQEQLSHIGV